MATFKVVIIILTINGFIDVISDYGQNHIIQKLETRVQQLEMENNR